MQFCTILLFSIKNAFLLKKIVVVIMFLFFSQNDSGNLCFRFCCLCVCVCVCVCARARSFLFHPSQTRPALTEPHYAVLLPVLSRSLSLVFSSRLGVFTVVQLALNNKFKLSSTDARPSQPVLLIQFSCPYPRMGEGRCFHRSFL